MSVPEFDPAWLESEDAWSEFDEPDTQDVPPGTEIGDTDSDG